MKTYSLTDDNLEHRQGMSPPGHSFMRFATDTTSTISKVDKPWHDSHSLETRVRIMSCRLCHGEEASTHDSLAQASGRCEKSTAPPSPSSGAAVVWATARVAKSRKGRAICILVIGSG